MEQVPGFRVEHGMGDGAGKALVVSLSNPCRAPARSSFRGACATGHTLPLADLPDVKTI